MNRNIQDEKQRILKVYEHRDANARLRVSYFTYEDIAQIFRAYERYRETLRVLKWIGFEPLSAIHALDVGCGNGNMLRQFVQWGALPENLAGIELRPDPVVMALHLSPNLDVRCGSATELPWPDAAFDLVSQHTVFTSMLDTTMKQQVAAEMKRVLRPGGAVLWYDFMYNNPHNPDVRGVPRQEIEDLFLGFRPRLKKITLAPPIARRIPTTLLPVLYPVLASFPFLRTHYLGLLVKPS